MTEDRQLLREYNRGSEPAFRELVTRYINLVYSAALRRLHDTQLAEDVVQTVFTALARKSPGLSETVLLGGWLYRHACFVAAQTARTERRRLNRERQAMEMNAPDNAPEPDWEKLSPLLDDAMEHLRTADRDAVVLHYFQGRTLRDVGLALGVSEEAARKRVTRAIEKLRVLFNRRGVALPAATLAALLSAHAVVAAPAELAVAVGGAALSAAAGTGSVLTLFKITLMSNLKITIIGTAALAVVVLPIALHYNSKARLREADEALRQRSSETAAARAENERLSGLVGKPDASNARQSELQRLQQQAETLARQTSGIAGLRTQFNRLSKLPRHAFQPTEEQRQEMQAKMGVGKAAVLACMVQARSNKGMFPPNLDQITASLPQNPRQAAEPGGDGFELVYHGSFSALTQLTNVQDVIVIRQKVPSRYGDGWAKVYVCGDGHCEIHTQDDEDFGPWESEHTAPSL